MSSRADVFPESRRSLLAFSPGPAKRGLKFWIYAWVPAAIAVTIIALESTKFGGADHTTRVLRPIWTHLFGAVSNQRWETIHWRIRKSGHFIGYGLVSALFFVSWYRTLRVKISVMFKEYFQRASALAMLATVIIASSDEIHQMFLPNRGPAFHDVVLDTIGGITAQLIIAAIYFSGREDAN